MAGMPGTVSADFQSHGWKIVDPEKASISCQDYQDFITDSAGEFTVAKEIYSELPSGWFSDRSSIYLACGRPVVTQDSGFDQWLPTGEGLFAFRTLDEAADALNTIAATTPPTAPPPATSPKPTSTPAKSSPPSSPAPSDTPISTPFRNRRHSTAAARYVEGGG